jgi:hypothetical protein
MQFYNSFNEMFCSNCSSLNLSVFNERYNFSYTSTPKRQQGYSSCLSFVEWNEDNPLLMIVGFADSGAEYTYTFYTPEEAELVFEAIKQSRKPGEFYNDYIKGRYNQYCSRPGIRGSLERQSEFNLTVGDKLKSQEERFDYSISDKMDKSYSVGDGGKKKAVPEGISAPRIWSKRGFSGNMPTQFWD